MKESWEKISFIHLNMLQLDKNKFKNPFNRLKCLIFNRMRILLYYRRIINIKTSNGNPTVTNKKVKNNLKTMKCQVIKESKELKHVFYKYLNSKVNKIED